jgi:hypothetical protein
MRRCAHQRGELEYARRMRCIAACGWLSLALACSFDASGLGDTPGAPDLSTSLAASTGGSSSTGAPVTGTEAVTGSGTGDGTSGAVDPSTGAPDPTTSTGTPPDPTTGDGTTTTGATTTTGDDTTTTGVDMTTGLPDQTTGPDPCESVSKVKVLALDATISEPMVKVVSMMGNEGTVVYSQVAEMGTADFAVSLECPGEYAVWARVLDQNPGINGSDPDSFHLRIDGGVEQTWFYGCQTDGMSSGYRWLRTGILDTPCNESVALTPNLTAGTHNFMFRNREASNGFGHVAALSRLLVTTDMDYVPTGDD